MAHLTRIKVSETENLLINKSKILSIAEQKYGDTYKVIIIMEGAEPLNFRFSSPNDRVGFIDQLAKHTEYGYDSRKADEADAKMLEKLSIALSTDTNPPRLRMIAPKVNG